MRRRREHKIRIKVVSLGYFPFEINLKKVQRWKSQLFEIVGDITIQESIKTIKEEEFYSDIYLQTEIEKIETTFNDEYDFLFAISNIKLKDNWYSRALTDNIVIMSYKKIISILEGAYIPSENAVIMLLYTYALMYKKNKKIPNAEEEANFLHGDTRGCLFDLSANDEEVIYSCIQPIICKECSMKLAQIDAKLIEQIRKKELGRIKRQLSFDIWRQIKKQPLVSGMFAVFLPISLSLLTSKYMQNLPKYIDWILIILPIGLLLYLLVCIIKSNRSRR